MSTSGWNLQQGNIPFRPLSESEVIRIVNVALSPSKMHTTTYKYAFFKAMLDNLFNVNLESHFLDYDAIALRFTEIYRNLVLNFHRSTARLPALAAAATLPWRVGSGCLASTG